MTVVGGGKINRRPCTEAEEAANWGNLYNFVTIVNEFMETAGVTDNFTVKCTSADTMPSVLHDALTTAATHDPDADPLIATETASPGGDETETLFLDASAISGYSASGTWALCEVDGVITWVDASGLGGGSDAFTVKCTTNDTTASFLHAAFTTAATKTTADPLIAFETANPGSNETETAFLDASAISGYSGTGTWALCEVSGTITWVDTSSFGGGSVAAGLYIDVSGSTVSVDLTEVSGYNASNTQVLMHISGTIQWKDVGEC